MFKKIILGPLVIMLIALIINHETGWWEIDETRAALGTLLVLATLAFDSKE